MSDFGDIGGGLLSLIGTNMQNQAAWDRQAEANRFSAQQFATRYQTTVQDLKAADLNPMLAYGSTPVAPTSTTPAPVQNALGNAVSAYQHGKQVSSAAELQKEQSEVAKSQVNVNNSTAAKQVAEAAVADEQAKKLRLEQPKVEQETKTSSALMETLMAQGATSAAQAKHYGSLIENLAAQNKNLQAELTKLNQSNDQNAPESEIAKKYPTFYYIFHKLMPTLSGSMPNMPRITNIYKPRN